MNQFHWNFVRRHINTIITWNYHFFSFNTNIIVSNFVWRFALLFGMDKLNKFWTKIRSKWIYIFPFQTISSNCGEQVRNINENKLPKHFSKIVTTDCIWKEKFFKDVEPKRKTTSIDYKIKYLISVKTIYDLFNWHTFSNVRWNIRGIIERDD